MTRAQYAAEHQHPDPDDAPDTDGDGFCLDCGSELTHGHCMQCLEDAHTKETET